MVTSTPILESNKKYFFRIFFGIDARTASKFNFQNFNVLGVKINSTKFKRIIKELNGLENFLQSYLQDLNYIKGEAYSYLFYSTKEENLDTLHIFLMLLRPAKINLWLSFDTLDLDLVTSIEESHHQVGTFSEWVSLFQLYDQIDEGDLFYLTSSDIRFSNVLVNDFTSLIDNSSFKELIDLYYRAYFEETSYFKYLLLFMIIESLIRDDEYTGVVFKIRRFCAVLIGNEKTECTKIFQQMKWAYDIRSGLVHSAKMTVERSYILYLHSIVCELLRIILLSKIDRGKIFELSIGLGFGQRNTLLKASKYKSYNPLISNYINITSLEKKKSKK